MLRKEGYKKPILLLTEPNIDELKYILNYHITPCVNTRYIATKLNSIFKKKKMTCPIHIEVDTGMNRSGIKTGDTISYAAYLKKLKYINIEGIFTHLADADMVTCIRSTNQLTTFNELVKSLDEMRIEPKLIHIYASSGIFMPHKKTTNCVRIGSIIYGIQSSLEKTYPLPIVPALTWKSKVLSISNIPKGAYVGYGKDWCARKNSKIATISVGYSDGVRKTPGGFKQVLCRGNRAPVIGTISMCELTVDVSNIAEVSIGDEIVLIGKQEKGYIGLEEIAKNMKTVPEEITTSISQSIPRLFI